MSRRTARPRTPREEDALPPLSALVEAPLANPGHVFMPGGKRRLRRAKVAAPEQFPLFENLPTKAKLGRRAKEAVERLGKIGEMLDHYARTDVPLEEVASHCLISRDRAREELAKRGRHV